jgi:hypothetical protein
VEVHTAAEAANLKADTQLEVEPDTDHHMADAEVVNVLVVEGNESLASCSLEGR